MDTENKRLFKQFIKSIIGLIIGVLGIVLCVKWYDWKFFIIMFLLLWSNNITNNIQLENKLIKIFKSVFEDSLFNKVKKAKEEIKNRQNAE